MSIINGEEFPEWPQPASAESLEWLRQRGIEPGEGGFTQDMADALKAGLADMDSAREGTKE